MFVWQRSVSPYNVITLNELEQYVQSLQRKSVAEILETDATGRKLIVEVDSSSGRIPTLTRLCGMAYGGKIDHVIIDNGVDARYGRLSLKLRAEKPNPYFDKTQPESESNPRYLTIDNPNLRCRGICDQLYKEYSYWVRNARIVKRTVKMTLAQFLAIDKTKRVRVGDIIGFIRKMQFGVSNQDGLGLVTMEILYI